MADRNRFVTDEFTTIEIFSLQYKGNAEKFKSYIESLHKTFTAVNNAGRRAYNNLITFRCIAVAVHYYDQALHSYNTIPDIGLIIDANITENGMMH